MEENLKHLGLDCEEVVAVTQLVASSI